MQRVFIITHALTLALGASLLHSWQAESRVWAADKKIERLQADLRTASGKVYDMQEQEQDKLDAAHGAGFTEAYEACKRGDIKVKYVVIKVEDYPTTDPRAEAIIREMPVVFPEHMVHSMVYDSLAHMLRLEVLGTKRRRELSCVGAGFMSSTVFPAIGDSFCHGKSVSLNVKSRGTEDDALFSMYDYHHGIK